MNYELWIAHYQLICLQQCRMYPVIPALLKIACWAVYLLVHCSTSRFVYNANLASVRFHGHPCPFWNYKARVKNNRRRAFCTLRIFSSGRDAAGYIRSDVSASLKPAAKSVQGCTLLAMQRRRRYAYFQKTLRFSLFALILFLCWVSEPYYHSIKTLPQKRKPQLLKIAFWK